VEALNGGLFERAIHPFDLTIGPGVSWLGQTMLHAIFVPVAVACSLSAVMLLLLRTGMMPTLPPIMRALRVALAVGGVASAWLLHTVFTLRYAYLYYANGTGGGLDFPAGSARPNYLDFAYFGFSMTAQTSDVSISGSALRHTALLHGLISFIFNTAVVAISISGLVGVL
jgi:uncharacterized membrane protein